MRLKLMVVTATVIGLLAIAAALATQDTEESRKQMLEQILLALRSSDRNFCR